MSLSTPEGVRVGTTVAGLRAVYGEELSLPSSPDECDEGWWWSGRDVRGELDGDPSVLGVTVNGLGAGGGFDEC